MKRLTAHFAFLLPIILLLPTFARAMMGGEQKPVPWAESRNTVGWGLRPVVKPGEAAELPCIEDEGRQPYIADKGQDTSTRESGSPSSRAATAQKPIPTPTTDIIEKPPVLEPTEAPLTTADTQPMTVPVQAPPRPEEQQGDKNHGSIAVVGTVALTAAGLAFFKLRRPKRKP